MGDFYCKIHGDLHKGNAWIHDNRVVCSACGVRGESVRKRGSQYLTGDIGRYL